MLGIAIANIRNIPACAGKTWGEFTEFLKNAEHPRVRGENLPKPRRKFPLLGTSPRARGKQG